MQVCSRDVNEPFSEICEIGLFFEKVGEEKGGEERQEDHFVSRKSNKKSCPGPVKNKINLQGSSSPSDDNEKSAEEETIFICIVGFDKN